ncbi:MAG: InlB B-repeat-containing protein, partial [Tepidiformaceae bacterium]
VAGGVTPSWTITPPADRPTASVALGLEPHVDLSVLGVVGPSLSIPISMNATMAPNSVPWIRASATLEGDASIHGGALFLPDKDLGPFTLFSESGEFYRSPTAGLQVFHNGAGIVHGSVESGVEAINCGLDGLRCAAVYNAPVVGIGADSVTLSAQPAPGWRFFSWGGACASTVSATCTVSMDHKQTVTALFVPLAPPQP